MDISQPEDGRPGTTVASLKAWRKEATWRTEIGKPERWEEHGSLMMLPSHFTNHQRNAPLSSPLDLFDNKSLTVQACWVWTFWSFPVCGRWYPIWYEDSQPEAFHMLGYRVSRVSTGPSCTGNWQNNTRGPVGRSNETIRSEFTPFEKPQSAKIRWKSPYLANLNQKKTGQDQEWFPS